MYYINFQHKDENENLKRQKDSVAADFERVSKELRDLKSLSTGQQEEGQKCKSRTVLNTIFDVCHGDLLCNASVNLPISNLLFKHAWSKLKYHSIQSSHSHTQKSSSNNIVCTLIGSIN